MNILDLETDFSFGDDVQINLLNLFNKYGKRMMIKYKEIIFPIVLTKFVIDPTGLNGFRMYYNVSKPHAYLKPFEIFFIDPFSRKLNNNSYISNIQRIDGISGTTMVLFVLELQRKLGVEKSYLHDAATIICDDREMDLTLIKILERGEGFYSKLGFDYEPLSSLGQLGQLGLQFATKEDLKAEMEKTVNEIRSLKISKIINVSVDILELIFETIRSQQYDKLEIEYFKGEPFITPIQTYHAENPYLEIKKIIEDCRLTIDILSMSNTDILYKYLIELFNDPQRCHYFPTIINILMKEHPRYRITFGSTSITRYYTLLFTKLSHLRHSFILSYDFTKHKKINHMPKLFDQPESEPEKRSRIFPTKNE